MAFAGKICNGGIESHNSLLRSQTHADGRCEHDQCSFTNMGGHICQVRLLRVKISINPIFKMLKSLFLMQNI